MTCMVTKQIFVSGRVQGVGFRHLAQQRATALGLMGWVRNLPDGRVELKVGGTNEAVQKMIGWLQVGPPQAHVKNVEVYEASWDQPMTSFEIRR